MAEHDLVIRGRHRDRRDRCAAAGTADVAVTDGVIAAVGQVDGHGRRGRSTPTARS